MARPKGTSKWTNADYVDSRLPSNVKVKRPIPLDFNWEVPHTFIDTEHGEWVTSCRIMVSKQTSTHPKRRTVRNNNPRFTVSQDILKEARKKKMMEKYGVEHNSQLQSRKESLQVNNPMFNDSTKQKLKDTCMTRYGVTNGGASLQAREKIVAAIAENAESGTSKQEKEFRDWIRTMIPDASSGFIGGANPKQLDVKIKDLLLAIEFHGTYWHSEKFVSNSYHLDKMLACRANAYKCIQVFSHEWEDRNSQVKSFLTSSLGCNSSKVYARTTIVEIVPKEVARDFLNDYHILGSCSFDLAYGLYKDDELLSLVVMGKHHRTNEPNLLKRFVTKTNITVVGGLSKLTKHIYNNQGPITTFIDLRWSTGESWIENGWKLVSTSKPDYFYYNSKNGKVISKQSRKKSVVGTPRGMTEREHAKIDGLLRVYDCGKMKLIYT